jgi:HK97 family phage major capsid protein
MGAIADKIKKLEAAVAAKKSRPDPRTPKASEVFGLPNARTGENPNTSRPFELVRAIKALIPQPGQDPWAEAKVELEVMQHVRKAYAGSGCLDAKNIQIPFCTSYMPTETDDQRSALHEIKSRMRNDSAVDVDQIKHAVKNYMPEGRKTDATMSWLDQLTGGSLVGPPVYGELIDLWRNNVALIEAGVTQIPMPPTGLAMPRQTSALTASFTGENRSVDGTAVGTGLLKMTPKKCVSLCRMPNDLIRYGGPAAEQLIRMDLTKSLALAFDLAGLQGAGTDLEPRGIINTTNIGVVTPTTVATDGNTLASEDLYKFLEKLAQSNAKFEKFVMNPGLYYRLLQRRNAISTDKQAFTFDPMRRLGDKEDDMRINGYPVVLSNQVSVARVKGSGTNLTYLLAGMFSDVLMALLGAMELAVATQGDTAFAADQTVIRGILIGDFGVRHAGALAWADSLLVN